MRGWGRTWWLRYCLDYIDNWNSVIEDIRWNISVSGYDIAFCFVSVAGILLLFIPAGCLCWSWFWMPRAPFLMLALILGYSVVPSGDGVFCDNQQRGIYTFDVRSLGVAHEGSTLLWSLAHCGYEPFLKQGIIHSFNARLRKDMVTQILLGLHWQLEFTDWRYQAKCFWIWYQFLPC